MYKEDLERATPAKIPFNPYNLASQPVGNPRSTLKTSYILDLICWVFFPLVCHQESHRVYHQVYHHYQSWKCQDFTEGYYLTKFLDVERRPLPCCLMNKWTRVLSTPLLAADQPSHADPWSSLGPALGDSPSCSVVFSRAAPSEGPGMLPGTWVKGLAKAGNSWEGAASGREQQGGMSSVGEVPQPPAGPLGHHGLQACPWERRLKEKPARARICRGVNILGFSWRTHLSWKGTGRSWCLGCSAELWLWWR